MAAVGIGGVVLHSSFLGKKLGILKPLCLSIRLKKQCNFSICSSSVHDLFVGVGVGLPCTVMECGDIIYRSTLPKSNGITVTVPGVILALGTLSYLWATPGVAPGFFDMFVLAFIERFFRPIYKKVPFTYLLCPPNSLSYLVLFYFVCRMILYWERNLVRDLLVLFIEFLWQESHHQSLLI